MEIKQFTRANLKPLEDAIVKALQPVAEEFGIKIARGSGSFSPTDYTMKVVCSVKNQDGTYDTPDRTAFKKYARMYGFEPEDLDLKFTWNNSDYRIAGMKPRSKKYPIICERADGKKFKFGPDIIKFAKVAQKDGS
jgi:hypothetical protein